MPHLNVGAYCRIDVPRIVRRLAPELRARGLDDGSVLYTDTDVAFAADWDRPSRVHNFAAGTEVFSPSMNSGVMVLNVSGFGAEVDRMLDYAETKGFDFLTSDQALIQQWFMAHTPDWRKKVVKSRAADPGWDTLDDASYNARPYAHPRKPSAGGEHVEPKLWHWHGYKPSDVDCWLNAIESGAWRAQLARAAQLQARAVQMEADRRQRLPLLWADHDAVLPSHLRVHARAAPQAAGARRLGRRLRGARARLDGEGA